jgi:DegV family protein with EDD domain
MRIGLVVDSACDLPISFIREHNIEILPITVHVGGQTFLDKKDPEVTAAFYANHMAQRALGDTTPVSVEQIKQLFLERLVLEYDFVFLITTASSRSEIYENALKASFQILAEQKAIRAAAGRPGPFVLRVIDSQVIFGAIAVSVTEAARMIRAGAGPGEIEARLNEIVPQVYGYVIPHDMSYLRETSKRRGEQAVAWPTYALTKLLNVTPVMAINRNRAYLGGLLRRNNQSKARLFRFAAKRIKEGLLTPAIGVGFGGDPEALESIPGFAELRETAKAAGVELIVVSNGVTAGIYLGEGSIALAFAAREHRFE